MYLNLKGKVAIITGAGRGIGAGIAKALAAEGCNIVINDVNNPQEGTIGLEETYGVKTLAVEGSVADENDVIRLFEKTIEVFGGVDILVNNAGIMGPQIIRCPIEEFEVSYFKLAESVMIEGMFLTSREFVKQAKKRGVGGHIINISSKSAFWSGSINNTQYATIKAANAAFTKALAHEVASNGIYVNSIIPGYVFNSRIDVNSERYKETIDKLPTKRYATPEEMGYTIAYLCSDKAEQINGAIIDCTGGTMNGDIK